MALRFRLPVVSYWDAILALIAATRPTHNAALFPNHWPALMQSLVPEYALNELL